MAVNTELGLELLVKDELLADIETADLLPRRTCFAELKRYLSGPTRKVLLLNGLRRTGKTTLAKQGIAELPEAEREKTVFVRISEGVIPQSLPVYALLEDYYYDGYRCFVVDECTAMRNFPAWAKDMADGLAARGCHVVLLGTNSLSLWLSKREFLEGRYEEIRTTRIPFHEWQRVLRQNAQGSVKKYIYYGGILDFDGVPVDTALVSEKNHSFRDASSIDYYVHSSIALNIQNSLARHAEGKDFGVLRPLWEDGRLTDAIMRIVQNQNHILARDDMAERFEHRDFYEAYKAVGRLDQRSRKQVKEKKNDLLQEIEDRLCLSGRTLDISKKETEAINKYLRRIDVFEDVKVLIMPSTDPLKRRDKKAYEEDVRVLQTQPGIRSGQMKLACGIIWNVLKINRTPIEKEQFLHLATSVVEGQLLEDIVFADLKDILPNDCDIFKLEWDADPGEGAEFDVAVLDERDPASPRVSLFEIKHTRQIHGGEARHLKNLRAIAQVAEVFGKVVSRTLVYLGPTERRAVLLVNADEFLQTIGENPEDALFPQCSEKWKPLVALEPGMCEALTPSDA